MNIGDLAFYNSEVEELAKTELVAVVNVGAFLGIKNETKNGYKIMLESDKAGNALERLISYNLYPSLDSLLKAYGRCKFYRFKNESYTWYIHQYHVVIRGHY